MIFKYSQLIDFFVAINTQGETKTFKNWKGERVFLLRHDVDFDVQLAYDLAKLERDCNIVSTFFVLTTCETYNVLSEHNRVLLRGIAAMGHEVGLHFDPSMYPGEELEVIVDKEIDILSFAIGQQVCSISLHNPGVYGNFPMFKKYNNAYDPRIFNDDVYIADSRMSFRGKDPFAWLEKIDNHSVQIFLHPLHYSEEGYGYDAIFCNSFVNYIQRVDKLFSPNSGYRKDVGEDILVKLANQINSISTSKIK